MQDVDEARLDQLGLGQRRRHAQDRLAREEHGAFRHGVDIAGEPKGRKMIEQARSEASALRQPLDVRGRKAQVLEKVERLLQPGGDQKAPPSRQIAHEELEYRGPGLAVIQIGLDHVELVKVGQQGLVAGSLMAHPFGVKLDGPIERKLSYGNFRANMMAVIRLSRLQSRLQ